MGGLVGEVSHGSKKKKKESCKRYNGNYCSGSCSLVINFFFPPFLVSPSPPPPNKISHNISTNNSDRNVEFLICGNLNLQRL